MKLNNLNVGDTIAKARELLKEEKNISPALRSVIEVLLALMQVMLERFSLNSKNSNKPPSSDPNRKKKKKDKQKSNRKPGGQPGRVGKQLKPVR